MPIANWKLKMAREINGYSQATLAEKLQISDRQLREWERKGVPFKKLGQIVTLFNLETIFWLFETGNPSKDLELFMYAVTIRKDRKTANLEPLMDAVLDSIIQPD